MECTQMENLKVLGFITGKMVQYIKGHLKMDLDSALDYGSLDRKDMKVNILMIKEMARVLTSGQEEAITKETLLMILDMDLARCIGVKTNFIKGNGKKECIMGKEKYGIVKN